MGYFAVLKTDASHTSSVRRTHINLWALPGLVPGRRLFYFDVGLELVAGDEPVSEVQMLLPFRVERGEWPDGSTAVQDLFESVTNASSAELIFGGPVEHASNADGHFLRIGDYPDRLKVMRIDPGSVKPVDGYWERADSSLYALTLEAPIPPKESAYIRIRWRVFGSRPLWRWKRLSGGARVDLRICDVRESKFADVERSLRTRMLSMETVNVFLMASPKLQCVAHSPAFKYLRILEPGAWRAYLSGASHFGRVQGLLVYYWSGGGKSSSAGSPSKKDSVNVDNPYRVFVDLNRAVSQAWWMHVFRTALGFGLTVILLQGIRGLEDLDIGSWHIEPWKWVTLLLGGAAVSWVSSVEKLRAWAAERFLKPRLFLRQVERRILSIGSK